MGGVGLVDQMAIEVEGSACVSLCWCCGVDLLKGNDLTVEGVVSWVLGLHHAEVVELEHHSVAGFLALENLIKSFNFGVWLSLSKEHV